MKKTYKRNDSLFDVKLEYTCGTCVVIRVKPVKHPNRKFFRSNPIEHFSRIRCLEDFNSVEDAIYDIIDCYLEKERSLKEAQEKIDEYLEKEKENLTEYKKVLTNNKTCSIINISNERKI